MNKKAMATTQVTILLFGILSFAILIGGMNFTSANDPKDDCASGFKYQKQNYRGECLPMDNKEYNSISDGNDCEGGGIYVKNHCAADGKTGTSTICCAKKVEKEQDTDTRSNGEVSGDGGKKNEDSGGEFWTKLGEGIITLSTSKVVEGLTNKILGAGGAGAGGAGAGGAGAGGAGAGGAGAGGAGAGGAGAGGAGASTGFWDFIAGNGGGFLSPIANIALTLASAYFGAQLGRWAAKSLGAGADGRRLATAFGAGAGAWAFLSAAGDTWLVSTLGLSAPVIGAIIAAGVWFFSEEVIGAGYVYYHCYDWQPQSGGENCGLCNKQEIPCSEYQCKSLGQGCKYESDEEDGTSICWWASEYDTSFPIINADKSALTLGYNYIKDTTLSAPERGVYIKPEGGECVQPYETLTFGIYTDEPSICKYSKNGLLTYPEMEDYFGSSNLKYNQSVTLKAYEIAKGSENNFSYYVSCSDMNQPNEQNYADFNFVFKFCIEDEPDERPPIIKDVNPQSNSVLPYGTEEEEVTIFVNRPGECKWSFFADKEYSEMENSFSCGIPNGGSLDFPCNTTLTGIENAKENKFYFKCQRTGDEDGDGVENNYTMRFDYEYSLVGSTNELIIAGIEPNATTIEGATDQVSLTLKARTEGGNEEGWAWCKYRDLKSSGDYKFFTDTESNLHYEDLKLSSGEYKYSILCYDKALNLDAQNITFNISLDQEPPQIARAYYEAGKMKLVTTEKAECVYSNLGTDYYFKDGLNINTRDGINHFIAWDTQKDLFIKCKDEFGNKPAFGEASIIVRAYDQYNSN